MEGQNRVRFRLSGRVAPTRTPRNTVRGTAELDHPHPSTLTPPTAKRVAHHTHSSVGRLQADPASLSAGRFVLGKPPSPSPSPSLVVSSVSRLTALAALATAAFALHAIPLAAQARPAPKEEPWRIVAMPQSTLVLARDGSLIGEMGRELRTSVAIKSLPKYVAQAFVAVEDKRFYEHDGVDIIGIAGALKDAVGGDVRGASTITQLLVGNMHPDIVDRRDRSLSRKLREQQAAREMEKHYSKEQILEAYLNTIAFGRGWYGIEAASRHYFGKPASRLTLAEAASLASMPKSPTLYDPSRYPDRNRERRNTVLALMAQQKYITRADAEAAQRQPVTVAREHGLSAAAPGVVDVVRQQAERAGIPVYTAGGYRIVTTIDPALQRHATESLRDGIAAVEKRPGYRHPVSGKDTAAKARSGSPYLQGAVVAVDANNGEVRALVGGRDYIRAPFNRAALALRQPGSAFKPLIYAAAIADSLPPTMIVGDTAISIPLGKGQEDYSPTNSDGKFLGLITMREALALSRNPVAVQLATTIGLDSVASVARRAGIETPVAPFPSSALGASAVHPLDFVATYTAFGPTGEAIEPRLVARVEDRAGKVVWTGSGGTRTPTFDPRVTFIVRDMMQDVVERGTATGVRRLVPASIPVAGKTGTTNDNADVWFVGMTPELVAGVWLGFDAPKSIMAGAAGGTLAAPIWGQMVARWYGTRSSAGWPDAPEGVVSVEMDRATGMPADETTPPERRYAEYFLEGTEPGARLVDPWRVWAWGPLTY